MSDVKKIDISTTNNFQNMMDPFRNVAVNQSNLNQGITIETIDMETLDTMENLSVVDGSQEIKTSYTKEELNKIIAEYKTQRKSEIEEYNKILENIEKELENLEKAEKKLNNINDSYELTESHINDYARELALGYQADHTFNDAKLKELGLTEKELLNMPLEELIEICKKKDSQVTGGFLGLDSLKNDLNAKVQELTEFENYDEFHKYMENLKSDQMTLTNAIQKTNELIDCAEYNFIPLLEEYQNYTYKEATINDLNNNDISPLEKFRALNQEFSRYNIVLENKGKLENLLSASEIEPELAKMYNYLYDYQGEEAATTYLFSIESTINQINGKQKAEKFLNSLTEEENAKEVLENHLKTSGKGLVDGGESFLEGIAAWIKSSRVYTADEYESMYILQALQNDEKYDFLLDDNYQISQSIGNMLPSMALSMVLSPAVGTVSMGVSAGGNSYHSALVEGQSVGKSAVYGVLSGLSEAALERLFGGIPGLGDVDVKSLKTFAQAMVQEGIEEGTQEHIDALMRAGIFKEDYDIAEVNKNAAKSAIYGAITAGIMNTPNLATSSINKVKEQNNAILDDSNNLKLEDLKYNNHSLLESVRYTLESNLKKYVYSNTNNFTGLNESIMKNGLYHFSNSVDSILDSGYIKPSGINSSYGNPKVFFFSGIPTVGSVATNLDTIPLTATAIKINPDMNLLNDAKIKVRNLDDGAISYDGKFDLTNQNVSKEYFCLTKVGDELIYKPVSKEIYENYANTEEGLQLSEFLNNKKNVQAIKDDYLYSLSNKMNNADETYKISTEGLPKEKANIIGQWNNDEFVNIDTTEELESIDITEKLENDFSENTYNNDMILEDKAPLKNRLEINGIELENEILRTVDPNLDPVLKARKLYYELNKRLHYDANFLEGDSLTQERIYSQDINFNNLNTSRIVCSGWASLYRQLLIDSGFASNDVQIMGNAHKWIEIDLRNGSILIVDATENINYSTDLANCKYGGKTFGFLQTSKENSGLRIAKVNETTISQLKKNGDWLNDDYWLDVDRALGYVDENQDKYFLDTLSEADELFGNSTAYNNLFGQNTFEQKANYLNNMPIPQELDGMEAYFYFNNIKQNLFNFDEKKRIRIDLNFLLEDGQYIPETIIRVDGNIISSYK